MKRTMRRWCLSLLLLAGCGDAVEKSEPVANARPAGDTGQPAPEEVPPPSDAAPPAPPKEQPTEAVPTREISIDAVTVTNPVSLSGRARTFENNVVLRLRDASGAVVAEGFTTARGEMGHHNPYHGSLWLTRDPGPKITVEVLEYSAKDGSERSRYGQSHPFQVDLIEVSVRLPNKDCTALVTEKRRVPKSVAMARLLVEVLMDHPMFPEGAAVNSVNLRDGVLTVDFNERLQNVGGACAAQMIRASVNETLATLPAVNRVVITASGSESLALQP